MIYALPGGREDDIARIFGAGHSYMSGFNNAEGGERFMTRLAAGLHAEEVTYAIGGAVLALDSTSSQAGGYANVINGLTPRIDLGGAATYAVRNAQPYLPLSPVTVFDYGINDLFYLTSSTTTNVAWFSMALTACCCIARAGGWFPDTDGSVAYSASWTANTNQSGYGWSTNHSTTSTSTTVTISVPADFPGGEVDILTLTRSGGAKWSAVVDGGAAQVLDGTSSAYGSNSTRSNLVVQRLTGLAAGAHTIVVTVTAIDGGATAIFQGWLIAAPLKPAVILVNQPLEPALPVSAATAHSPVTASDVLALNAGIAAVAASFTDGNVVVADIAASFAAAGGNVAFTLPGSLYSNDNDHPNAAGHALIAQTIQAAIRQSPPPAARSAPQALLRRQINGPLEPQLSLHWTISSGGTAIGWFGKDRAGNTVIRMTLQKSIAGVGGETILTLPPGYNPGQVVFFNGGVSWGAGFSSTATPLLEVTAAGAVLWTAGDPTTELDVYDSWYADGLGS